MAGYPCCCEKCPECLTPLQITVSGITNGTCSNCGTYNAVYLFNHISGPLPCGRECGFTHDSCCHEFQTTLPAGCGTSARVFQMFIAPAAGGGLEILLEFVLIPGFLVGTRWITTVPTAVCENIDTMFTPADLCDATEGICDFSSASLHLEVAP